jgi:hypothetical protein
MHGTPGPCLVRNWAVALTLVLRGFINRDALGYGTEHRHDVKQANKCHPECESKCVRELSISTVLRVRLHPSGGTGADRRGLRVVAGGNNAV